ncbi:ankyrin repeat domain-containing protein [Rossellomorea sp. GCM10028870]|uniref:ankyrin repeat domain-containing protein n=1 Tax=unclassified Rossellomorea TaxID=2837526 RepID=UPI0030E0F151
MKKMLIAIFISTLAGCSFNAQKEEKEVIFTYIKEGYIEEVETLIDEGTDINQQDALGRTPVMLATYQNNTDMVRLLIDKGADIHLQDELKNNPFLYAGAEGMNDILLLTIEAGADPALVNRYGGTALIPAAEKGHGETVKLLLDKTNVDINHVNDLGWTALMEAIVLSDGGEGHQEIIATLIEYGADVTIPDREGKSPIERARERGFVEIEEMLLKAGAVKVS